MKLLRKHLSEPSDIYLHLGLLHGLASRADVQSIVEIGFRTGASATAFCATGKPVTSIDNKKCEPHATILRQAYGKFKLLVQDSLKEPIPTCDLLFIDGEHTYKRVSAELAMHVGMVNRFIVLHDTATFGVQGKDGSVPGLADAVSEFLDARGDRWDLLLALPHNNGLTVLERLQ